MARENEDTEGTGITPDAQIQPRKRSKKSAKRVESVESPKVEPSNNVPGISSSGTNGAPGNPQIVPSNLAVPQEQLATLVRMALEAAPRGLESVMAIFKDTPEETVRQAVYFAMPTDWKDKTGTLVNEIDKSRLVIVLAMCAISWHDGRISTLRQFQQETQGA